MMSLLNPRIWLAFLLAIIVSLGVGGYSGYHYEKNAIENAILKKDVVIVDATINKERVATGAMATIGANLTTVLSTGKAKANNELTKLKAKLATTPTCVVSGDVVGMLYPDAPADVPATPSARLSTGSARTYPDSTCSDQLELADRNYREVCEPNAEQLTALQQAYNAMRDQFNDNPKK
jgi:hypothetical protein